ncbi:MAG: hypothetical protein ACO1RX_02615 [Candidatus Sericytochromatia bacterium]
MKSAKTLLGSLLIASLWVGAAQAQATNTTPDSNPGTFQGTVDPENTTSTPTGTQNSNAAPMTGTREGNNAFSGDMGTRDTTQSGTLAPGATGNTAQGGMAQGSTAQGSTNTTPNYTAPQSNTRVDVNTSGQTQPAAPNIDIDMPDINMPGNSESDGGSTTVTERSERFVYNNTGDPATQNNNMLYMGIFGVLAVVIIAMVALYMSRRNRTYPTV